MDTSDEVYTAIIFILLTIGVVLVTVGLTKEHIELNTADTNAKTIELVIHTDKLGNYLCEAVEP